MYINKAMVLGNLTRDPELKSLPSGTKVVIFSVATNQTWKDAHGERKESVEYHNIVFFGKTAEIITQYSKKGSSIYIEGRIQTRSWDGQDGKKNYRTEIVGDSFQFGPKTQIEKNIAKLSTTDELEQPTPKSTGFSLKDEPIDWPEQNQEQVTLENI